jgi:hypothetical protein
MKPRIRIAPLFGVLAALVTCAGPAAAIELRLSDGSSPLAARFTRAFAPCTAPNTVSWTGIPACLPSVTSACLGSASFVPNDFGFSDFQFTRPRQPHDPAICTSGTYEIRITTRATVPQDGDETFCTSPICTLPDDTAVQTFVYDPTRPVFPILTNRDFRDGNLEILAAEIIAPDGLPMLAFGSDGLSGPVGVAYPPCTSPDPGRIGCSATAWRPACDFNAGTIDWVRIASPGPHVVLAPVGGASPLCTTGTYHFTTTVRPTLPYCNNSAGSPGCTLPDQTVTMPMNADGTAVDVAPGLALGGLGGAMTVQILEQHITDPTGALLASMAFAGAAPLQAPNTTISTKSLRIRTLFPPLIGAGINPARSEGVTFLLTSRGDPLFSANIPASRWQLEPPLGERWDYKDPGGVIAGIHKASIRLKRKKGVPIGYDVRVFADGLSATDAASVNLTVTAPLTDDPVFVDTLTAQRNRICRVTAKKSTCR